MRWMFALAMLPAVTFGGVYKCKTSSGFLYQDHPCHQSRTEYQKEQEEIRQELIELEKERDLVRRQLEAAKYEERNKVDYPGCGVDFKCYYNQNKSRINRLCESAVESRAKVDFEWIDGWTESKFETIIHGHTLEEKYRHSIVVMGDQIKMQNGFGLWIRQSYGCVYSPATRSVVDVVVETGRLD